MAQSGSWLDRLERTGNRLPYPTTLFLAGTLYTIAFALAWSALLGVWVVSGWALGPGGPLTYAP